MCVSVVDGDVGGGRHVLSQMHIHVHAHTHMHTHTHMHSHTRHTHTTHMHTHTHTHTHTQSTGEREWLQRRYEKLRHTELPPEKREGLGLALAKYQAFDRFLTIKFQSLKRYGAEGAESIVGFFEQVLQSAGEGVCVRVCACVCVCVCACAYVHMHGCVCDQLVLLSQVGSGT